jgi:antitoxin (DNA-binding transcriptional repressor) of toxin-antitoxin stability system
MDQPYQLITDEEAEAHWFEFLDKVQQGQRFTITIDGMPIAEIRPPLEDTQASIPADTP